MQLIKVIYVTSTLCLFASGAYGQENISESHIKLKNDSSKILSDKARVSFDKTDLLLPNPEVKNVEEAIDNTNFKTDKPFYIPPYYINPTPCSLETIVQVDILSLISMAVGHKPRCRE